MALPRNLLSRCNLKTPPFPHSHRLVTTTNHHHNNNNKKQPLHALFMEAVGLKHHHHPQQEQESESESNFELKRNLTQLQQQLRTFNKHVPVINTKRRSLFSVFTNQPPEHDTQIVNNKKREPMILKELSPEMEGFLELLFQMGYFNHANFAKGKDMFDLSWFDTEFGRGYIKFAAQRFGRDKQELAKWLSGSALKEVAMFGCPSIDRASVFPCKRLRKFFEVPENTVCSKCVLRESCKFENQSVWKGDTKILNLVVVMKVLTSYDLEMVHPKLVVPDTVKNSVRKLLKEAMKLSQTISD
ncbi:uncharacterized protein LOC107459824 [Arachis duranensis]|uniref:Uncharacterized protein LOC107459824 n=1 Tax=Arachis duranensis TaxID=130453 RepID=A0A6P4B427_ARADU|nr:uncharacterized protein LOC107459824 [Arachis duranensis]